LIPTFSPQGDGNLRMADATSPALRALIPTFSPQGDGNFPDAPGNFLGRIVDPYLFPARGRKPQGIFI